MASTMDYAGTGATGLQGKPVLGKIISSDGGKVAFVPAGTNYEFNLVCPAYAGPIGSPVKGVIRVRARKIWTVPSGGNFITPIFGPPRIIQGRVRALSTTAMVIQAGADILVELPDSDIVYDLASGPIVVGRMANVLALPGATFELSK